ncbi:hypothetical protein [Flavobacterium croceum]|uniref:Uncharacterized protein n=1 Tax=Flavobacterium croceum DSM 17960 TaxID=1121886 RepID=A0A2S4N5M1_9FLAO|nr:hypothetical protein [Flavobacterium croceum]POS01008.1 hypothetical protein Q361_11514 [Flavobacterium croceum DSM 17960]
MKNLSYNEILEINGGSTAPHVSNNSDVQAGYSVGWHIGHAIGQTIKDVGTMVSTVGDWIFG